MALCQWDLWRGTTFFKGTCEERDSLGKGHSTGVGCMFAFDFCQNFRHGFLFGYLAHCWTERRATLSTNALAFSDSNAAPTNVLKSQVLYHKSEIIQQDKDCKSNILFMVLRSPGKQSPQNVSTDGPNYPSLEYTWLALQIKGWIWNVWTCQEEA